jgi:diamine N-acetyltransferase
MITFRTPTVEDVPGLSKLGAASFVDAFGHLYSEADLSTFLHQAYSIDTITAELSNPNRLFRVAEEDGILVGYCKLGLDYGFDFDLGDKTGLELKQIYLLGNTTGKGIGSDLVRWTLCEARDRAFDAVVLSVYSGNIAGQRFYNRHGFTKWADTYFMVGNQRDDEYLYGLWLSDLAG